MKNFFLTTFIFLTEASKSHKVMDEKVNMPKMIQKVKLQKIVCLIDARPNLPLSAGGARVISCEMCKSH